MGYIFISYSHKDSGYAHKLAGNLEDKGISVWIDARLDYGSQWPHEIQKQLDACSAFILLMSPRAFASDWVQSELQRAKRMSKPIFPLLLEGDGPWLSVEATQYYDVRNRKMPDSRFFAALSRLPALSQSAETEVRPPVAPLERKPRMTAGISMAIIGVLATVCVASIGIYLLFRPIMNEPSPEPTTGIPVITATEDATEIVAELSQEVPASAIPTLKPTNIPQAAPATPIPTRKPTNIPSPPTSTPFPPTPAPIAISNTYNIAQYGGEPGTQRSTPLDYRVTVQTVDLLRMQFSVPSEPPPSDVILHILWDGAEIYTSGPIGSVSGQYATGVIDLSQHASQGAHELTISPEGVFGGTNEGYLYAWGGTLIVTTNRYP
jgi:hypothetical protein